jgi:hypothetical protein
MQLRADRRLWYVLASLALVAPCFWQPRLQAGDLSSHIYNAWLAQLIESGRAEGLQIVRQTTNVLFDLMLSGLFRFFGAEWAQRIAVSTTVLTFVWGAVAFVNAVSGRRSWHLLPCIAILAYGWVFHMGFFNFYLSMGLCFWTMSVAWVPSRRRIAIAVLLLALAYTAHALPVIWTVGLMSYVAAARRLAPLQRAYLTAGVVAAMAGAHLVLRQLVVTRWSPAQFALATGVDQAWVFDGKYYFVLAGLLLVWGVLFLALVRCRGAREVVGSVPFQLCVIGAAVVLVLPESVLLPGFAHSLSYIAERMSLGVAVCVCGLLGSVQPRLVERYALLVVAVIFFGFVYRDERALNAFEDRMQDVVSALPPGGRVVNSVQDLALRSNAVTHMIDRICVGRCYSYANYEPSTRQFRVRATAPNAIVVTTYGDSWDLQTGKYRVRDRDVPLYTVEVDHEGRLHVRSLTAGVRTGVTEYHILTHEAPVS